MTTPVSRREFVQSTARAACGALVVGFNPIARSWITPSTTQQTTTFQKLPPLTGQLLLDEDARTNAADDYGHYIHRLPAAVLKPGSVQDIVELVRFANRNSLKVAMHGRGHSTYGQAQAEGGVVIDSSTLNTVRIVDHGSVDLGPGALWAAVVDATAAMGKRPPVLVDFSVSILSVGGTLSVGGFDATSSIGGFQVDHVLELDVVTGAGNLVTCSPTRNADLFNVIVHGLGQCGAIVRARMELVPAPTHVTTLVLEYPDLATYIADCRAVATDQRFDALLGGANPKSGADVTWSFHLEASSFHTGAAPDRARLLAGLKYVSFTSKTQTWLEYQHRYDAIVESLKRNGAWSRPHPKLILFVPASAIEPFARQLLSNPEEFAWATPLFYPLRTDRMKRPLTRMPRESVCFVVNIHRSAPADATQADVEVMIRANRALYERAYSIGGKRHTIDAIPFSQADWIDHYGPAVWQMFRDAKKRFDPNFVLTPGQGIFAPAPTRT
jgi:cytokinin dehydrogenase